MDGGAVEAAALALRAEARARALWVAEQMDDKGRTGPDVARELGITHQRVYVLRRRGRAARAAPAPPWAGKRLAERDAGGEWERLMAVRWGVRRG